MTEKQERPAVVSFRLTEAERARLERYAKAYRRPASDLCRLALLGLMRELDQVTATGGRRHERP